MKKTIVVSGATGDLGFRIVNYLLAKGAEVRAVVRSESNVAKIERNHKNFSVYLDAEAVRYLQNKERLR